jgi:predicted nucleotide-binding protein
MAISVSQVKYFLEKIRDSDDRSFDAGVKHLFQYLRAEIKDNQILEKYEENRQKWNNWPHPEPARMIDWALPSDYEEAKSLCYFLYRSIDAGPTDGRTLAFHLFRHSQFDENINEFNRQFFDYFAKAIEDILRAHNEFTEDAPTHRHQDIVFIIHGHDEEFKTKTQLLLERASVNNVVLHEIADKGRTIIDKLIEEANQVGYAIALLSPDDLTVDGTGRARQNVILEIGYFLGLLGKERVRMIVRGNVVIPSDLQGILYEKYDDAGVWCIKTLKELQAVGIYVDMASVAESL